MTYTLYLESRAEKELEELPNAVLHRIDAKLQLLKEMPRPRGVVKLKGKEAEGWRVRVGNYRILYLIDDYKREVRVYRIKHRQEAYRK